MQSAEDYYKYCPGEEQLLISDAVCLGRRRKGFAKCPGCRFNDDEKAGRTGSATTQPKSRAAADQRSESIKKLFKAYDVRGIHPDPLDEEAAWRIGHAAGSFLRAALSGLDRADPAACSVVVGRDMRKSSPSLAASLIEGVRSTGAGVIDIGMIDTSQIYFAINHLGAAGGIQTTASHNPAEYNGFKISGRGAVPVGSDTGLHDISRIAQNMVPHDTGMKGDLRQLDLTNEYKAFVRRFLHTPRPLKMVVDASNGMAGKWLPILFGDVPELDLICLNMEHAGEFVHDPNPLVDSNLAQLQDEVLRTGADLGVCFDGDADRCMFVDEHAQIVRCDILTALLAKEFLRVHPGSAIVFDLRSSRAVAEEITRAGGVPHRERVGHAFMKKAMAESKAIFGGELSGHFYFRDNYNCDSGMLALAQALNMLTRTAASLSDLVKPLLRYSGSGERNFVNPHADATMRELSEIYPDARIDHLDGVTVQFDDWWFNVRKSNTEPLLRLNLEASTPQRLEEKLQEVAKHLGTPVEH